MGCESQRAYIVDDDPLVRKALVGLFQIRGYETIDFDSGEDLLDQIDPLPDDVLITDFQMAGITGIEVIEELARRNVTLPTILYSGSAHIWDIKVRAGNLPCVILEKPCEFGGILAAIQEATGKVAEAKA
ncbi:MAG: response regulator [Planctomycetales bacterium]|nr:response regulator [Planctomycetales bacterium]